MAGCSSCGAGNPPGYRFCGRCGAALPGEGCPSCGAPYPPGQRFCGNCGAPVDATAQPAQPAQTVPLQERKLATVVFADVVGFTSLSERTDAEVVARLVDTAFQRMGEVVERHGGTVDKYMGDSMMALFGVPAAHDDDAERAVAAALALRGLGGDLAFSIGVNSGEVMVTPLGRPGEPTVIGDAVNVAARLEKAAGPGEVLCGPLTVELVGDRALFRARQPVVLKGKAQPVPVWEAVALRSIGEGLPAAPPAGEPSLVGRTAELAWMNALWAKVAESRRPQAVLVCGDAGVGKTRLVAELCKLAARDGHIVRTSYPSYSPTGAGRVLADVVAQLGPTDDEEIERRLRSLSGDTDEYLRSMDPHALFQEHMWALARLMRERSAEKPLLVVIDDMHLGAQVATKVLAELGGRVEDVPLLVVLAGRSEPPTWLTGFPSASTVRLEALGPGEAAQLAQAFLCDRLLSADASRFLVERSGGNPLYLRELARMLRAEGGLAERDGTWHLAKASAVPATLQALLAARMDALAPAQKLALQYVAVLGEGATAEQVGGLGAADPEEALLALAGAGLLRPAVPGWDVADPLMREVAYESLPHQVRAALHRRAAGVGGCPEDSARHLERAAAYLPEDEVLAREAAEALAEAGRELARESRYGEAVELLERALRLGLRRPWDLLELANLQTLIGRGSDAQETRALVEDDPDDPTVAVERDHGLARDQTFSDPAGAREVLLQVAERWRELGEPVREAWAVSNAAVCSFNLSRMQEASEGLERAADMFEKSGDKAGAVAATSFLCLVRPTDPRVPSWLAATLEFAEASGDRMRVVNALTPLTWHNYLRSAWGGREQVAETRRHAVRFSEMAEELHFWPWPIQGRSLLTILARQIGDIEEAATQAAALERLIGRDDPGPSMWLAWAAMFSAAVAAGETRAAPPMPPGDSTDPVTQVAYWLVQSELVLAGRLDESGRPREVREQVRPLSAANSILDALALAILGRFDEAHESAGWALESAIALGSSPMRQAALALLAEAAGDPASLPSRPSEARSVSDLIVVRAHAVLGDASAVDVVREGAGRLAMPGLLIGVPAAGVRAG